MMSGYSPVNSSMIDAVTIMGLAESPSEVTLNDEILMEDEWMWHNDTMVSCSDVIVLLLLSLFIQVLVVLADIHNINEAFTLQWD